MKFKEFTNRVRKYLKTIRSIGGKEIYQGTLSFDVIQNTIASNNNILARNYTDHHIVISYYAITNLSKSLLLERNSSNFKQETHGLLDPKAYKHLNETEFIKNFLIEICIHELLHASQYINPLYVLNGIEGTDGRYVYSREKYLKYIEVPNIYKTICFIVDHKEELYRRLGYIPYAEVDISGFVIYNKLLKSPEYQNVSKEKIKFIFRKDLRHFFTDVYGNFVPYRKASIHYHIAVASLLKLKEELEELTVAKIKSEWMRLYKKARQTVIDYYKTEETRL